MALFKLTRFMQRGPSIPVNKLQRRARDVKCWISQIMNFVASTPPMALIKTVLDILLDLLCEKGIQALPFHGSNRYRWTWNLNPLSITGLLTPFLIGSYLEMFTCSANYVKALKLLHAQTCIWDYFFLHLFWLVQNTIDYSFWPIGR